MKSEKTEEGFKTLQRRLRRRVQEAENRPRPAVACRRAGIEQLRRRQGDGRIDALSRQAGLSPQYMRRVFRDHLGVTAKRIACLFRLNSAIALADGMPEPSWSGIAAQHGYADQAHLVNDCRRWTGCSPVALHRERRAERPAG